MEETLKRTFTVVMKAWPDRPVLRWAVWMCLLALVLAAGGILIFVFSDLPTAADFSRNELSQSSRIYDRNGELLYELHGDIKRDPIAWIKIPEHVKQAAVAIEDKDFYSHYGFDLSGILRAAKVNFTNGRLEQGGSTITQQLARNRLLTREKTYERKLKEIFLAVQLELTYSKDEILLMYLNETPYGGNAYGIEAASQKYFGKPAQELTLIEGAYLAALTKAPTYFSPFGPNKEKLDQRARLVMRNMLEQGFISKTEAEKALEQEIVFERIPVEIIAPHFVFYVQDKLAEMYGEERTREGGFEVYTTLDLELQKQAEQIVRRGAAKNESRFGGTNAALVAIKPKTGELMAMVGSRNFYDEKIDGQVNVTLSPRQPGSSFKPYAYATAFEQGMNPATVLLDISTNFRNDNGNKNYIPRNFDSRTRGPVSIRQALAGSLNIPAVKTLLLTGVGRVIDTAEALGISTLKPRERFGPALVLGGAEVSLLEHTTAIGAFGNQGKKVQINPIVKIMSAGGKVIYEKPRGSAHQVFRPETAYLISHILSDNEARAATFGSRSPLYIPNHEVAVKTGTTQNSRDAWTVGYTENIAIGVWAGNNDNTPMRAGGSVMAGPIWNEFMTFYLKDQPRQSFTRPDGIVKLAVDTLSGKLPTGYSPKTRVEIFASYNKPTEKDDVHVPIETPEGTKVVTRIRAEKDDPHWHKAARGYALTAGFYYGQTEQIAAEIKKEREFAKNNITLTVLPLNSGSGWEAVVETPLELDVSRIELALDEQTVLTHGSNSFRYADTTPLPAGTHRITVTVFTRDGKEYKKSARLAAADQPESALASTETPLNAGGAPESETEIAATSTAPAVN